MTPQYKAQIQRQLEAAAEQRAKTAPPPQKPKATKPATPKRKAG